MASQPLFKDIIISSGIPWCSFVNSLLSFVLKNINRFDEKIFLTAEHAKKAQSTQS